MRELFKRLVLGGILAVALVACGDGDDPANSASATIGPAGGTLTGPDGVQVVVPEGALTQDTTITITRVDSGAPAGPDGYTASTPVYEFTPHGLAFAQPVTIRMPFNAPAGAEHADVFMAGPGEPWESVQASVSDGMAEWQRATFSYGVGVWCVLQLDQDPYRCTPAQMNVPVVATPSSAMTDSPNHPGNVHTLSAEAALRFTLNYSAARDCGNPSVRIWRAGDTTPLLDQPVSLAPSTTNNRRASGSLPFDITLGHADNGGVTLAFFFFCTRPGGVRQFSSYHHWFAVNAPEAPASAAPTVLTQPLDQSVTAPAMATFSAAANGTPAPTWQWQRSTDGGASWSPIAGATSANYTTPATTVADDGLRLRAVATNASGTATTQSALLSVRAAPSAPAPFLGRWPTPTMIDALNYSVGGLNREPRLACGRSGSCIASWERVSSNDPINDGIYAARYTTAQGWGAPVQLSADRGRQPSVGVDDDGAAIVAWIARDGSDVLQAYARRFAPTTGWGNVTQMSPAGTDPALGPVAVVMGHGQAMVAYARRLDAEAVGSLWVARPNGSGWVSQRVPDAGVSFNDLQGVVDSLGRATLVWRGGSKQAMAASGAADGSWTAAVDLSGPRQSSRPPQLGVDIDGQAYVAWQEEGSSNSLHIRRRPAGAGWEPVQSLSFGAGVVVDWLDLAAGPAGSATVIYSFGAGDIVTRDFSASGGWNPSATTLVDGSVLDSDLSRIVMDSGGNVTVLWRGYDGNVWGIYTRSYAPGLGWSPALSALPVQLATIEQTYRETALAPLGDGRAAMLLLRTNTDFLDELLGAVQIP